MADVSSNLKDWSTTASSNNPAGSVTIGAGLDDNLREIQACVRGDLATKGADISSGSTTDLGAVQGLMHDITGTTTITGFGTVSSGIWKLIKFEGALTLTHNATSLILPGGANITTADGDTALLMSEGSGNWRVHSYSGNNAYFSKVRADTILSNSTTATVFNTVATTVNAFGAATTLTIGSSTCTTTINGTGGITNSVSSDAAINNLTIANTSSGTSASSLLRFGSSTSSADHVYIQVYGGSHATLANVLDINNRSSGYTRFLVSAAEAARINAAAYFKASNSAGTYNSATGSFHELYTTNNAGNVCLLVTNAAATATNQFGVRITLTGDPNDATRWHAQGLGNATERWTLRSNGGLANFQANDVNLCDAAVKVVGDDSDDHTEFVKALRFKKTRYVDTNEADQEFDDLVAQDLEAIDSSLVTVFQEAREEKAAIMDGHREVAPATPAMQELKGSYSYRIQQRINSVIPRLVARIEALEARP